MYIGERSCLFVNILVFYVKGKQSILKASNHNFKSNTAHVLISELLMNLFLYRILTMPLSYPY